MKNLEVTVKKEFRDRYTGKKHKIGETLTMTDNRFREIKRSGDYVQVVAAETKKK